MQSGRRRLVRASVTAVPFPGNAFDVVTSFDVIYSLDAVDERAAIAEMYRVTKPGGFVIVNVAAMECLRGEPLRTQSRGSPLQSDRPPTAAHQRRIFDRSPHIYERRALPAHVHRPLHPAPDEASRSRTRSSPGRLPFRPAPSTHC